mmetsp:Transcript_25705/g.77458  ORF Transcript_25705/g.77458 Transcript_25705/m.77458 type:complete len:140 (-) Transcript_25705:78-497(-)
MQWDPDHSPAGGKLDRRAIQLGLSPQVQQTLFNTPNCLRGVADITDFVAVLRGRLVAGGGGAAVGPKRKGPDPGPGPDVGAGWRTDLSFRLPIERPYVVRNSKLARLIGVSPEWARGVVEPEPAPEAEAAAGAAAPAAL